ncbi:MAG: GDP-mannose 4,6-dehydratase [Candidatus Sungbacteria bacterium]|nr:GDP-mannose 4,6-dehydratase [Candidatus Sungbacteria bacterium]
MSTKNQKLFISGGSGFIGHHVIDYALKNTAWDIVSIDMPMRARNPARLAEILTGKNKKRVSIIYYDLQKPLEENLRKKIGNPDYMLHLAASSSVPQSIGNPLPFVMNNVLATMNILEYARALTKNHTLKKFINFSTVEVFGPARNGYSHKEEDAYNPSNPYAASKASQASLGRAYATSFELPVITTFTMNTFGERQYPEKFIPTVIRSVREGKAVPIFAELDDRGKLKTIGSRYWIYAQNTASALLFLLKKGKNGESYNIVGFDEYNNLEIAQKISGIIGMPLRHEFVDYRKHNPGHENRYALDGTKIKNMGWSPEITFDKAMERVVTFTLHNPEWLA